MAQVQVLTAPSGTTLPSGVSGSTILYQNGTFIGIGTQTPAGPLEVTDESIAPYSATNNKANIVISENTWGGSSYYLANCGFPSPTAHCTPDNALILRAANFNQYGVITSYGNLFTMNRNGQMGVNVAPFTQSGLSLQDYNVDIQRVGTTPAGDRGIYFRNYAGTINHSITTSRDNNNINQLNINAGVDGVSNTNVQVNGNINVGGTPGAANVIINGGSNPYIAIGTNAYNINIPAGYSIYAQYGMLVEKVKVAIKI